MKRDVNAFRERFNRWKQGDKVYESGRPLPAYEGGKDVRPVTTGGAGYIPDVNLVDAATNAVFDYAFGNLPTDTIRQRLYNNIKPLGYSSAITRARKAVVKNESGDRGSVLEFIPITTSEDVRTYRDNIFAEYLQIPKDKRRGIKSYQIVPSQYRPTKGDQSDNQYFKIDENTAKWGIWDNVYRGVYKHKEGQLNINQNAVRPALYGVLGKHTVGRGHDDRGEYMSYADVWDLAPYGIGGEQDQSNGIGKPVHVYDRKYLDDYFEVSQPTHATWLPEITVTGHNQSKFKLPNKKTTE